MNRLSLSQLGFGCYGLGGAYGRQVDAPTATRLIHMAYDLGIRFFDTADNYGAEEVLGKALGSRRTRVVLATKVGAGGNLSREHIVESCQASLRRLATDYLDLYQVHYDDPKTPAAAVVETLEDLKGQGKIRAYGLGHLSRRRLEEYLHWGRPATVLAEFSAAARDRYMELRPLQGRYDFGIVAFSITGRGLLTGTISANPAFAPADIRRLDPLFRRARLAWGLKIADRLRKGARDFGVTPAQMAIAWVLHQPGIVSALTGPLNPDHLRENCVAREIKLDPAWLGDFQAFLCQGEAELRRRVGEEICSILSKAAPEQEDLVYVLEHCVEMELLAPELAADLFARLLTQGRNDHKARGNIATEIRLALKSDPAVPSGAQ
jgi:aryl-alcohol dehydrogenase-like predicted oxidoreductase